VKLTTHLRLVPRSKDGWSCTSTPSIRLHGVVLRGSTGTGTYVCANWRTAEWTPPALRNWCRQSATYTICSRTVHGSTLTNHQVCILKHLYITQVTLPSALASYSVTKPERGVHRRLHRSTLRQLNSVHAFTPCLSTPSSPKLSLSFRFSDHNSACFSYFLHTCNMFVK
jgi:hypothetical protein